MATDQWIVVSANAIGATALLFAAFAKFAAPQLLARSLLKLTNRTVWSSVTVVRAIGSLEIVIAFGLLVEATRPVAAGVLVLLGLSFVGLGILGRIRKVDEPCGCFGAASQQPLGTQNILLGTGLTLIGAQNFLALDQLDYDPRAAAPMIAAGLLCLLCIVTSRSTRRPASEQVELH